MLLGEDFVARSHHEEVSVGSDEAECDVDGSKGCEHAEVKELAHKHVYKPRHRCHQFVDCSEYTRLRAQNFSTRAMEDENVSVIRFGSFLSVENILI